MGILDNNCLPALIKSVGRSYSKLLTIIIDIVKLMYFLYLQINKWCKEAGDGVTFEFEQKNPCVECTKLDASNPFWVAFKAAADEL